MRFPRQLVVAAGLLAVASGAYAQSSVSDSALVANIPVRSIGPANVSGRISDIDVATPRDPAREGRLGTIIYAAAATGGVWKSTNAGVTWTALTNGLEYGSIGDIAVAPSDPNVIYVGTGESNNMRSSSWGNGIYKSTDAGRTWTHIGLTNSQHIARIVVHPRDANTAYVAAVGPLWAAGGERGVFKTTDGGRTWTNVKAISANTGFTDLVMDPANPEVLYAASLQRERRAYSFIGGGPETGLWKTTDAGRTWTQINNGLPKTDMGRIGISACRSAPQTLYAVVHSAPNSHLYRTNDGGANWTQVAVANDIPWFFGQVRCDPTNPDHVWHLGVSLRHSYDGGKTWVRTGENTHADHHAMWINPEDPAHVLLGNDGGFFTTYDAGRTWDFAVNLPITQFYAITYDLAEPFYNVYGGLQDNSSYGGPSRTRLSRGVLNTDWFRMNGGDGFYAQVDPTDTNIVYSESQNGALVRYDRRTGESKSIRPLAEPGQRVRYNWSAPILISPHDAKTVYFASQFVYRTTDRGDSWTRISDDLTRNVDVNTLPMMGKVPTDAALCRHCGTAEFGNIATLDESPIRRGLLITGSDDGVVAISRDGGQNWTKMTSFPGVPDTTYVSRVIASRHHEGTFYVTFDGHRSNDFKPYALKTTDFGRTWTNIAANLPNGSSLQVIREHHRNANLLFAGNEWGVYFTLDGGRSWTRLRNGMPGVPVHDLLIHPRENDLIIGTHGRGIYIVDDLAPFEKLAEAKATRVAYLFPVENTTSFTLNGSVPSGPGSRHYRSDNLAPGAPVYYQLNNLPQNATVELTIVDAAGNKVRTLNAPAHAGMSRVVWDLRHDAPTAQPRITVAVATPPTQQRAALPADEEEEEENRPRFGQQQQPVGPHALPGQYTARLVVKGGNGATLATMNQAFTVRRDDMIALTDPQMRELFAMRMRAAELNAQLQNAIREAQAVQTRVGELRRAANAEANKAQLDAIERDVNEVLRALRGAGQGGGGGGGASAQATVQSRVQTALGILNFNSMPTQAQREALREAPAGLQSQIERLGAVIQRLSAVR